MKLKRIFAISFFKSIYLNLNFFGVKGFRLPIVVSKKVKFGSLKGKITLKDFSTGKITIGFGGSEGICENRYSYISVSKGANIVFSGKAGISAGSGIRVDNGTLSIGNNFSTNKNCFIACSKGIDIGDDVTLGWNVNIRDNDGHKITDIYGNSISESKNVTIGNHVWLCSYTDVLKGVVISDNSVVAYKSLVSKPFFEKNILIAGCPAKKIKENIGWEY